MSKRIPFILSASLVLMACQQPRLAETQLEAIQTASDVYLAYERGDCPRVYALTEAELLKALRQDELRDSLTLARAFCFEREGQTESAVAEYGRLQRSDRGTFGATDATERLQYLRALATDTEFAAWVDRSLANAKPAEPSRTPLSRIPAEFPPAARAAGIEGYSVVEFGVSATGETEKPLVVASNPPLLFDGTSLRAVRQWQFVPDETKGASKRQVIRILFQNASGITLEDAQQLTE